MNAPPRPVAPAQGPLLRLERADRAVDSPPLAHGRLALFSAPSPAKTTPNEDGALVLELAGQRLLLAVADGVGGRPGGALAARVALETLAFVVRDHDGLASLREAVLEGFERASRAVAERAGGGATTLVVATVEGRTARLYHVGDSGALLVGGRGRLKHQTVAHSPTGWGVEAGWIGEREALKHEERHLVSNVVGTSDMRVEVSSALPLAARDTLLLASDGLFDNLVPAEIARRLASGSPAAALERLASAVGARMERALDPREEEGGAPDDLTLLAWRPR